MIIDSMKVDGKLYYLGSPYSKYPGGLDVAFQHVAKLTADLMKVGITAYSPITHTHPIAIHGNINPLDYNIWLPFDHVMMKVCDAMIVARMSGWAESYGVGWEIEQFEKMCKPVIHLDVDYHGWGPCEPYFSALEDRVSGDDSE